MANTVIQLRNSTVTGNVPSSLANGEISINSRDGKFFYSTPSGSVITHYPYLGPAGLNKEIQFNDSGTLGSNSGLAFDKSTGYLISTLLRSSQSSGDEGGQLDLATAATNNTLVGGFVNIDIYQNKLRIFESGGTNRGVYIDMANGASTGVGTNLLSPSSSTDGWARNQANAAFAVANTVTSASNYANGAFAAANAATATDTTQNNSITAAFNTANASFTVANSALTSANGTIIWNTANAAFTAANSAAATDTTQNNSITAAFNTANAAFVRANNSLDANNGGTVTGTITATSFITSGSFGNITGANTIYANNFVANTGYIQFADGSKQYTANAGSGGSSGNAFGVIYTSNNNTFANATTANAQLNFVGESGVVVYANSTTKTITVAGTPGAQGLTVDYGYVYDSINYSIDYGTL